MHSKVESIYDLVSLNENELIGVNGGSIRDVFITGGKILATVGVVVVATATIVGSAGVTIPLVAGGAVVAIAGIWAL